jgi:hypothetical protein
MMSSTHVACKTTFVGMGVLMLGMILWLCQRRGHRLGSDYQILCNIGASMDNFGVQACQEYFRCFVYMRNGICLQNSGFSAKLWAKL